MNGLNHIAGGLRLAPGAPVPHNLLSTRQDWVSRLAPGQAAAALPGFMASLFNLCGQAHRLCSQLAIDAAAPGLLPAPTQLAERLRLETAQEHVRRIALDWPRLLGGEADVVAAVSEQAQSALRSCPLLKAVEPDWPAALVWIEAELLGQAAGPWLKAWHACGADGLHDWSRRHSGWLPRLIGGARALDNGPALQPSRALRLNGPEMGALAEAMALLPGFALRPVWRGRPAHTGSWSRLNGIADDLPLTPWALLGCRLAELVRLCQPTGATLLSHGQLNTAPGQGLAWAEMARGLLLHQVVIAPASGDAPARVVVARVVAPTEWNFHPEGEVAQRLALIHPDQPADALDRSVRLLMAAFDPCVAFSIDASHQLLEQPHA